MLISDSLLEQLSDELTTEEARDRLDEVIHDAFEQDQPTLVEALPAMGKSYRAVKWASTSENQLTILTSRHDLYDQYEKWCREHDLTYLALPAFQHDCPTMGGDHPIEAEINEIYDTGIFGATIHEKSHLYFGRELPCQEDGPCPYMEKREFDPEQYDVLIGHYLQAHNPDYVKDRYVVYDEFPGDAYFFEPSHNRATRAVTNYLEADDRLPFNNWKELFMNRHKPEYEDAIDEWTEDMGWHSHRDTRHQLQRDPGFDALAPILLHAALELDLLDNQWERADLGKGRVAVRSPEDEWTVLIPPALYAAESVVALDGTPMVNKWRLVLGGQYIEQQKVLETRPEKQRYVSDLLGLSIIQTDAGAKPYASGEHVNCNSDGALLEGIEEREGDCPTVISSKNAIGLYENEGLEDHIKQSEHFGNLKGTNELGDETIAAVIGSPHPPEDETVVRWGAIEGESIERKTDSDGNEKRGENLDFGGLGNALFNDVVKNEVLQAIMRFGRNPDEAGEGATVYVHTSRLPHWVKPESRISVQTWSDGMKEVIDALQESDKWPDEEMTNREISEGTSIGRRQVSELMKELDEEGYIDHRRGGQGNAFHWSNVRLEDCTQYGSVE